MNIERFCIKFFTRPGPDLDEAGFIDIFHEWIRLKKLGGILLDVTDYRHVPNGPGVMLITHEINFAMDHTDGRFGLLAQRKRGQGHSHQERLMELLRVSVAFATLLETDPRVQGKLSFEGGLFEYISNDRLAVPNDDATFAAIQPDLAAAAALIYPNQDVSITRVQNDPRARLTVVIDAGSVNMSELVETMGVVA
ncbi:MAG TPA: hypothetical protein VGD99_24010 [Anaerolineae bacterium]|jgi:hypothetical protein